MWLIHLLPTEWTALTINLMLLLGVLGTLSSMFISYLPSIVSAYRVPLQLVGVVLLVMGVFYKGGLQAEQDWRDRVIVAEHRAEVAEQKSAKVNTVIVEKEVVKTKYITEVKWKTKTVIKEVEKIIDSECKVRPEAIEILNSSAQNILPKGTTE